jgi:hypothetical protein
VADPKNYTGIFPSTYGGSFITQDLISPLLQPFLRREEIRPEEIQPVEGSEAIRINPQTGMPEAIRDIEVVPGEYGPIESGGGIQGLLEAGVLNFLKAKNFLSTPEGREQVATVAQEMPSQLVQAGEDYVLQQVDMANRGLQEVYDPETNTIVDFTFPQTVAETMLGTAAAQPAIQLQRGEFIAPMVQKVKGGTQIPVDDRGTFLDEYKDAMKERGDESRPFDLATEKFSAEEMENVLNKIEKYYRDEAGTPDDPIRAMLLRGDLEPSAGDFGYKSTTFDDPNFIEDPYDFQLSNRGVTAMPPSLLSAVRTQADLADEIIVLQNQLRTLNETHTPIEMGGNPEFFGYRNAKDLQQARSLQTQIAKLSENDTALRQQTADRQFFDRTYDQALPIEGRVLLDKPGEVKRALFDSDTRKLEDKTRSELRENVAADLARRQAEYEQLSLKLNPAEPFEGFANAAELQRYRDLARGPRFPEEAAPFSAVGVDLRVTPIDYFRQRDFDDYSDLFGEGGPMERAIYEEEILYTPDISDLQRGGLGFLEPETFVNNLQLVDPKKVKNMSFPQMVKAGVDAQKKEFTTILKSDKPEQIAAALKNYPKLKTKLRPQILLESKGLETMLSGEKGVIVRLLRPEETELEGVLMNHSVGGYNDPAQSQYNRNRLFDIQGGKDSFLKGEKRVYSLRDRNTGQPRVTIDLAFDTETNLPLDVQQVKGLGNNENLINEDLDLIATFLKELGVNRKTHITEGNNIGLYLEDVFADTYAEGGIVSLANGGAVEHGIVTL